MLSAAQRKGTVNLCGPTVLGRCITHLFVLNIGDQTGYEEASSGAGEGRPVKSKHFAPWLEAGRGGARKEGRTDIKLLNGVLVGCN